MNRVCVCECYTILYIQQMFCMGVNKCQVVSVCVCWGKKKRENDSQAWLLVRQIFTSQSVFKQQKFISSRKFRGQGHNSKYASFTFKRWVRKQDVSLWIGVAWGGLLQMFTLLRYLLYSTLAWSPFVVFIALRAAVLWSKGNILESFLRVFRILLRQYCHCGQAIECQLSIQYIVSAVEQCCPVFVKPSVMNLHALNCSRNSKLVKNYFRRVLLVILKIRASVHFRQRERINKCLCVFKSHFRSAFLIRELRDRERMS